MFDFILQNTEKGGDFIKNGLDFEHTETYESMIYLACFSGSGFWGNALLKGSEKIECETEKAFAENSLSSAGRIAIENAIKNDLSFLSKEVDGVDISIDTKIIAIDRMDIRIRVNNLVYIYQYLGEKTKYIGTEQW